MEKKIEDSLKDGLIITIGAAGIILRVKGGKRKTTKDIPRCHGYTKTCWWYLRRRAGERLCCLQKMDQRVNTTTKILWPSEEQ